MNTTQRKHGAPFAFWALFFALLLLPCTAQEAPERPDNDGSQGTVQAAESSSASTIEYQATDMADDAVGDNQADDFATALEDEDSAKPLFTLSGKIETLHGVRWNSDKSNVEYGASRSIAKIKGEVSAGSSYAVVSAAAEYNYRNLARTGFRLNEAYYRYSGNIWDISVGRQVIAWGQADGFKLTDVRGTARSLPPLTAMMRGFRLTVPACAFFTIFLRLKRSPFLFLHRTSYRVSALKTAQKTLRTISIHRTLLIHRSAPFRLSTQKRKVQNRGCLPTRKRPSAFRSFYPVSISRFQVFTAGIKRRAM